MTVTFAVGGKACSGGSHYDAIVTIDGTAFTFRAGPELFGDPITDADRQAFAKVLLRLLAAECKTAAKTDVISQVDKLSLTIAPKAAQVV